MKPENNREIEVKLRVEDLAGLLRGLKRLRARRLRRVHERNMLFDTPEGTMRRSRRLLRLRIETPLPGRGWMRRKSRAASKCILTFKWPGGTGGRYKDKMELETEIKDPVIFERILAGLGLAPTFRYEKVRTYYQLPGVRDASLELDETPIGIFLEVEGSRKGIDRAAKLLGKGPKDYIAANYWVLYCAECRRRGRRPGNMVFPPRKKIAITSGFA
ncbi:MAG: CYTH domain-containing protein [Candidatus Acidiferrales bacterium]